jgi:cyanuric acid amidohydrolase
MNSREIRETRVFRLSMANPGDLSELAALFDAGTLDPHHVAAIIGKTEGNGGVNDFTRGYFTQSLMILLGARLKISPAGAAERVPCVLSGGTEGVMSPHYVVFARTKGTGGAINKPALAVGTSFSEAVAPEVLGRMPHVEATADAVRAAMADAGLAPEEVHFVQVKAPCLTSAKIEEARRRGKSTVASDPNRAMAFARAAGALGAALALGDVPRDKLSDGALVQDTSLYSSRVSASSGVEISRTEVIVLGNGLGWAGKLRIAHREMADALDVQAIHDALHDLGIPSTSSVAEADRERIKAVLIKAEPDRRGQVHGYRHTMLDDTDINAQRHIRAAVGGMSAAALGDGRIFISGGAEHQGPDGGGLVAIVAETQ